MSCQMIFIILTFAENRGSRIENRGSILYPLSSILYPLFSMLVCNIQEPLEARIGAEAVEIFVSAYVATDAESGVDRLLEPFKRRVSIAHHRVRAGNVVQGSRLAISKMNR